MRTICKYLRPRETGSLAPKQALETNRRLIQGSGGWAFPRGHLGTPHCKDSHSYDIDQEYPVWSGRASLQLALPGDHYKWGGLALRHP